MRLDKQLSLWCVYEQLGQNPTDSVFKCNNLTQYYINMTFGSVSFAQKGPVEGHFLLLYMSMSLFFTQASVLLLELRVCLLLPAVILDSKLKQNRESHQLIILY